jgi:hypothetical protein
MQVFSGPPELTISFASAGRAGCCCFTTVKDIRRVLP